MTLAAEQELAHTGETCGCVDPIHGLRKLRDARWRYDQHIASADGKLALQALWRDLKQQKMDNIQRVKRMISAVIWQNCF